MLTEIATHLSLEDVNRYLLGEPSPNTVTAVEEHYLECAACLELLSARAAQLDNSHLSIAPMRLLQPLPAPAPFPVIVVRKAAPAQWGAWVTASIGAAAMMTLGTFMSIRPHHPAHSPRPVIVTTATMSLPSTRSASYDSWLPDVEFKPAISRQPVRQHESPLRFLKTFQPPERHPHIEMARLELPDRNLVQVIDARLPLALPVPDAPVYRAKPNLLRRIVSAIATPFRSPRT
jgi:hypothetical protein